MPMNAHEKDEVFVGRLRRDETQAKTLNMWVVSDNLRKGAATNAVQIAEYLLQRNLLNEAEKIESKLLDTLIKPVRS
jgi:aspartate-semialdehyde dehydrogenase